jgi:hypothetical protein
VKTTIVVLVVGLFAVGIPALVRYTVQAVRAHRLANAQTPRPASCPSTGAGRGHDHCTQRGCPGEGLFWVMADGDAVRRLVCWFCLREGFTKGWWVTFYRADDVYDQEATA